MTKSMTGFGRCEATRNNRKITVEIKAVNHRYLDLGIRLPKKLSAFENTIRLILREYVQRGKIDVYVTYEDASEGNLSLQYNESLAREYLEYLRRMAVDFALPDDLTVCNLARLPEVFTMAEPDTDESELQSLLEEAVRGAAQQFTQSRITEGENLCQDMLGKLEQMLTFVDFIEARSPQIIAEYRTKLTTRVKELLEDKQIDDSRIAMEVTIFADKMCVDEETVRLRSHIEAVRDTLKEGNGVGRKLDFLAQEMNREANTILSKSTDLAISDTGIDLKTAIEKIREQIQNIE